MDHQSLTSPGFKIQSNEQYPTLVRGGIHLGKVQWKYSEALPGGGAMSPVWILKHLVLVFINACHLLSPLPSLSQFGQGRLSLVAISFYALSLLFGPCHLLEFTLAGSLFTVKLLLRLGSPQSWGFISGSGSIKRVERKATTVLYISAYTTLQQGFRWAYTWNTIDGKTFFSDWFLLKL